MVRVLLIEEDEEQQRLALECLSLYNDIVLTDCVADGDAAKEMLQLNNYDMILAHLEAPKVRGNGLLECAKGTPAMIFTSDPNIEAELDCFKHGAGDYIARPYNFQSALARGERLLLRTEKIFGNLRLNYKNNIVVLSEKEVLLTPIELKFLFFIANAPEGADFKAISKFVWGYDEPDMNSMRVLVSKINKKLGGKIENVRNWGYKIKNGEA